MMEPIHNRQRWLLCLAALAVWIALAWPILTRLTAGEPMRGVDIPAAWLAPFALFGAAVVAASVRGIPASLYRALMIVQVAAVLVMAVLIPWAGMSMFLIIVAWQVALAASPRDAIAWAVIQTLAFGLVMAKSLKPDLCWVIGESFAFQMLLVFTANALRKEAHTALALAHTNAELRAAQAFIANTVRDAERLRISRELHDAWGHELTALSLQLEIAGKVGDPVRSLDHVGQARTLAGALLGKVRDVVGALREAERHDLQGALEALVESVPAPRIHLDVAPGLRVGPDQAHALIRCAQEAVTNAMRHADAANLWLSVREDDDGVRLVAHNDGGARSARVVPGSGLLGMQERMELLGGSLAVEAAAGPGFGPGFTIDAWLPAEAPRVA